MGRLKKQRKLSYIFFFNKYLIQIKISMLKYMLYMCVYIQTLTHTCTSTYV